MKKRKKNIIVIAFKSIILLIAITSMIPNGYGSSEFPSITGEVEFIHEIAGSFQFYAVSPTKEKIMYGYTEDYTHYQVELIDIDGSNQINVGEYMKSNERPYRSQRLYFSNAYL